jgi:hypothetical protein
MAALSVLAPLLAVASVAGAPQGGVYESRLCVSVAAQPAQCGPAEARMLQDGDLRIQVNDIVYHLIFGEGGNLVGVTLHGAMQVAEFASPFRWKGASLAFGDAPRGLRYELLLGKRLSAVVPQDEASAPSK